MKEQLILWTGAIVITFLIAYMGNVNGKYYPMSGTIGVNGEKITFKFDRIYRSNNDYTILLRKDVKNASAFIIWKKEGDVAFNKVAMKDSGEVFKGSIPVQKPYTKVIYRCEVFQREKCYLLPADRTVKMVMIGNVPVTVMNLYFFFLFGGIFLSTRGALEYFNKNRKVKVYVLFTTIFFFCYTIAVTPLKMSYELNAISHSVPSIERLFNSQSVILLLLWIVGMIFIISKKNPGIRAIIFSLITILVYLLIPITY